MLLSIEPPHYLAYGTLTSSFLWIACLSIYRLHFHPLAKFPGPKLAALTHWYEFYYDLVRAGGGQYTFRLDEMHKAYGSIVRVNPEELHIHDPDFHDKLYGGPGQVREKYAPYANSAGVNLGTFGTVDHYLHRHRRAAVAPLFSQKTVLERSHLIKSHVDHLCRALRRQCRHTGFAEVRATYLAYSTTFIHDFFFAEDIDMLDDDADAVEWKATLDAVAFFAPYARQIWWLLPVAKRPPVTVVSFMSVALGRAVKMFQDKQVRSQTAYRTFTSGSTIESGLFECQSEQKQNARTIFREIMSIRLAYHEKLPHRMAEEAVVALAAGSETVSRVLTTATFHLLENPSPCEMLQAELRGAMRDASNVLEAKQLEQLPYLTAVIKKALRLAALTMTRLPVVLPKEPLKYQQWTIPAGAAISITPHKILTDPNIFESPLSFRPERWLDDSDSVRRLDHHLIPFGKGNRKCLGVNLAQAQLYFLTATVFRRFGFELVDTIRERDIDPVRECFVGIPSWKSRGVKVVMKKELE